MRCAGSGSAWPDKVLWRKFPSATNLRPDAEVTQATIGLLDEVDSPDGVIMGITEDMPADRWQASCRAIMQGLHDHAQRHPQLYST